MQGKRTAVRFYTRGSPMKPPTTCFLMATSASFTDMMPRPAAILAMTLARHSGVIIAIVFDDAVGALLVVSPPRAGLTPWGWVSQSLRICRTIPSRVSKTEAGGL